MIMRYLLIITLLGSLAACTSTARDESPVIPQFESIAIVNMGVSDDLKARFGFVPEDSTTDSGALAGGSAGALAGAGAGALIGCVGFPYICAMVTAASATYGAMVGAAGGGLAAYAADSQKKLSYEQLLVLDNLFAQTLQHRSINQDIEHSLMQQVPAEKLTAIEGASTLLQYRLYDVRFAMTSSKKYALTLKTVMLFNWNRNSPKTVSTHRTYEHSSQSLAMEDWVQDDGQTLNAAFDDCIEGVTDKMLADIQFESL